MNISFFPIKLFLPEKHLSSSDSLSSHIVTQLLQNRTIALTPPSQALFYFWKDGCFL